MRRRARIVAANNEAPPPPTLDDQVGAALRKKEREGDVSVSLAMKADLVSLKPDHLSMAAFLRGIALSYLEENPDKTLPPPPTADKLHLLKETRPEALVYTIPIVGAKIVASENPDGGWRGILFHPEIQNSVTSWNSDNLNPPDWAKTPNVVQALAFVASRIDDAGLAYFEMPSGKFRLSAKWNPENQRFETGEVIDRTTNKRATWAREGWYNYMPDLTCRWNLNPILRRYQNMLCRVLTVGAGGLETTVPLR